MSYSTFIGNFAALVMTAFSGLGFLMSQFQDLRVTALLMKELYRQNAEGSDDANSAVAPKAATNPNSSRS